MTTLWRNAVSGNCWKVEVALRRAGIAYETRDVDLTGAKADADRAALRALSPIARVPLVQTDDGRVLTESNALLLLWSEGTDLWPDDRMARFEVHRWMFFEQNLHEPNVATRRFWVAIAKRAPEPRALLEHWLARGQGALETMDRHLERAPTFGPEGVSAADVALAAYTQVADEGGFDLEAVPAVRAWLDRMRAWDGWFPL